MNYRLDKFTVKQKAITILISLIILVIIGFTYAVFGLGSTQGTGNPVAITIKSGETLDQLTKDLADKKIIKSPTAFNLYARLVGYAKTMNEGVYYLKQDLTAKSALDQLREHKFVRVTIPEGYTVEQTAKLLSQKCGISEADFLKVAKTYTPYEYMKPALSATGVKYAVEGFLFPDTYDFRIGETPETIMKTMITNFDKKLTPQLREQASKEGLTIYQLVTMASLVEKEAKFQEDRPIIAQVFFSRLRKGMNLQSDATIQYAMPEHKEDFTIQDTKYDTPYNTYQHSGLTPGPIGNPGIASIKAVLQPANTDYIYFVADKDGHNHYSSTYEQHEANIKSIYGN